MANIILDIDNLYATPSCCVTLQTGTDVWAAPIMEDFTLSGDASFTAPFAEYASTIQSASQQIAGAANAVLGKLFKGNTADMNRFNIYKNIGQTINLWTGSSFSGFSVTMIFIVTSRDNADRYYQAIDLASRVYSKSDIVVQPDTSSGKHVSYFQMKAASLTSSLLPPNNYKIGPDGIPQNTWTVFIGNSVQIEGLVLTHASIAQSKVRLASTATDVPLTSLVSSVTCSFQPALEITDEEFKSWF